jgi:tripartite ATP-independent transporter DctM subunit
MFILAGNAMNAATISERIWAAADALVGRYRAGLGHVTVLMNLIVSSMSGSAVSDAAGAGLVAIRMMRSVGGYPGGFAAALTAAASTLGPIIPPSIPMVIYAILSQASVGALFLAGIVPGLLMAISLMVLIALIARRRGLPFGRPVALRELPAVFRAAVIPLTLPAVLLGGIWGGVFTPTESAAVAAFWAMLISLFVYRNLGLKALAAVFAASARQSTVVMMLIVSSFIVNFALEREGVAAGLAAWIDGLQLSPLGFVLVVNLVFLVLGTVLDGAVMLLVFVPVLLPSATALGIDLVHFGVVLILNFMIAMITPPYGLILCVLASLTGVPIREINREIWQFCVPLTVVLFVLIAFPAITLWLPRLFGYAG